MLRPRARVRGIFTAALALGSGTCAAPPTRVLLAVYAELGVPDELDRLEVRGHGPAVADAGADAVLSTANSLPRTLVLEPAGAQLDGISLEIVGLHAGVARVSQRVAFAFDAGHTRVLSVVLARRCVDVAACPDGQTCVEGACTPVSERAARDLPEWTGAVPDCVDDTQRGCYDGPAPTRDVGVCHGGTQRCAGGHWQACEGETLPAPAEVCDAQTADENCDGVVDERCPGVVSQSCRGHESEIDCATVDVSAARYNMGESTADNGSVQRAVTLTAALRVDATEVSVRRFRRFFRATRDDRAGWVVYPSTRIWWPGVVNSPRTDQLRPGCSLPMDLADDSRDLQPITCIDWWTAMAFCRWDGGRLPTEAEWERIARVRPLAGPGPFSVARYPWGAEEPDTACSSTSYRSVQWSACGVFYPRPIGSYQANGARSGGLFELIGNVAEWTADRFVGSEDARCWGGAARTDPLCDAPVADSSAQERTVRGGAFSTSRPESLRGASRSANPEAGTNTPGLGLRCVRTRP